MPRKTLKDGELSPEDQWEQFREAAVASGLGEAELKLAERRFIAMGKPSSKTKTKP